MFIFLFLVIINCFYWVRAGEHSSIVSGCTANERILSDVSADRGKYLNELDDTLKSYNAYDQKTEHDFIKKFKLSPYGSVERKKELCSLFKKKNDLLKLFERMKKCEDQQDRYDVFYSGNNEWVISAADIHNRTDGGSFNIATIKNEQFIEFLAHHTHLKNIFLKTLQKYNTFFCSDDIPEKISYVLNDAKQFVQSIQFVKKEPHHFPNINNENVLLQAESSIENIGRALNPLLTKYQECLTQRHLSNVKQVNDAAILETFGVLDNTAYLIEKASLCSLSEPDAGILTRITQLAYGMKNNTIIFLLDDQNCTTNSIVGNRISYLHKCIHYANENDKYAIENKIDQLKNCCENNVQQTTLYNQNNSIFQTIHDQIYSTDNGATAEIFKLKEEIIKKNDNMSNNAHTAQPDFFTRFSHGAFNWLKSFWPQQFHNKETTNRVPVDNCVRNSHTSKGTQNKDMLKPSWLNLLTKYILFFR